MTGEVDLGILSECEPCFLTSKFFPSKIGGKPAWLSLKDLPVSESLLCDVCQEPTVLLCQVYAPIEEKEECFHRTIFVFICINGLCCKPNAAGNIKVFRSQLARYNEFYSAEPPQETEEDTSLALLPPLCIICGCFGRFQCGGCHSSRYCSKNHQTYHWKNGHKNLCKNLNSLEQDKDFLNSVLLKEWLLDIDMEPVITSQWKDEIDSIEHEMEEFKLLEKNNATGTMVNIPENELEKFAEKRDKFFRKFSKRISLNPEQVLRFHRDGDPLWISEHNIIKIENVPACEYCKGPRIFEFQIMPQLLNSINISSTINSIDWGIICIYTCKDSCNNGSPYKKEYAYKQDI